MWYVWNNSALGKRIDAENTDSGARIGDIFLAFVSVRILEIE